MVSETGKQEETVSELQSQLDAHRETSNAKRPDDIKAKTAAGLRELVDSRIAEQALNVGDKAPDFTLPEVRGTDATLSEILESSPAVLAFYRGVW